MSYKFYEVTEETLQWTHIDNIRVGRSLLFLIDGINYVGIGIVWS